MGYHDKSILFFVDKIKSVVHNINGVVLNIKSLVDTHYICRSKH